MSFRVTPRTQLMYFVIAFDVAMWFQIDFHDELYGLVRSPDLRNFCFQIYDG